MWIYVKFYPQQSEANKEHKEKSPIILTVNWRNTPNYKLAKMFFFNYNLVTWTNEQSYSNLTY
jgi:hypothetical protein